MVSLLRSKLSSATIALAACACGPASFATVTELPKAARQPDGVLIEPEPRVPDSVQRAQAEGVIALEPPFSNDELFMAVIMFVSSFIGRSPGSFIELLVPGELVQLDSRAGRTDIVQEWSQRARNADYGALRAAEVARVERMERFDYDDLSSITSPRRPEDMQPGDVLLRVPLTAPLDRNGNKLFHDVLLMVIRPTGRKIRVAGVGELDAP